MDHVEDLAEIHNGNIHLITLQVTCLVMDDANKLGFAKKDPPRTVAFCSTNYFYIGKKEGWSYN